MLRRRERLSDTRPQRRDAIFLLRTSLLNGRKSILKRCSPNSVRLKKSVSIKVNLETLLLSSASKNLMMLPRLSKTCTTIMSKVRPSTFATTRSRKLDKSKMKRPRIRLIGKDIKHNKLVVSNGMSLPTCPTFPTF